MSKVLFMKIRNIVPLMDPQLQPPPSREFLAMHFLHSPSCPLLPWAASTAGEDAGRPRHDRDGQGGLLVVERRLEQGQWCRWLNFPAGGPGRWAGLASSSG